MSGLSDGLPFTELRTPEERREKKRRTKWVILEYMLRSNNVAMLMVIKGQLLFKQTSKNSYLNRNITYSRKIFYTRYTRIEPYTRLTTSYQILL